MDLFTLIASLVKRQLEDYDNSVCSKFSSTEVQINIEKFLESYLEHTTTGKISNLDFSNPKELEFICYLLYKLMDQETFKRKGKLYDIR